MTSTFLKIASIRFSGIKFVFENRFQHFFPSWSIVDKVLRLLNPSFILWKVLGNKLNLKSLSILVQSHENKHWRSDRKWFVNQKLLCQAFHQTLDPVYNVHFIFLQLIWYDKCYWTVISPNLFEKMFYVIPKIWNTCHITDCDYTSHIMTISY